MRRRVPERAGLTPEQKDMVRQIARESVALAVAELVDRRLDMRIRRATLRRAR